MKGQPGLLAQACPGRIVRRLYARLLAEAVDS